MKNTTLLKTADSIIKAQTPTQYSIKARFINSIASSTFSFYPLRIERLSINRNYAENFGDEIDLYFKISPHDYALMQDQGQNLICILTMTYLNKNRTVVQNPKPIQKQYYVSIINPADIRSMAPDVQNITTPSLDIRVRLIEKTIYDLRQIKLNTIFQNVTITQAIYAIANHFGIEKVHLTKPDNVHVYDHIPIKSYQPIAGVYPYLQKNFGVYQKGINSYVTDGVLYVYPAFDTDPDYDKSVKFYQVDLNRYAGAQSYHKTETNLVSVVVANTPQVVDLSIAGSENVGTGFIFTKASKLVDGMSTLDSVSGAQYTEETSLAVSLKNPRTISSDSNNIIHIPPTDNPFPHMSRILSQQASLMTLKWEGADPFILDPPHKAEYMYDKNSVMYSRKGMIEKAQYEIVFTQKVSTYDLFSCVGLLTLRLSPNEMEVV